MIRINRQTDYAIRVVLALARERAGARLSTAEIQRQMLIPHAFLPRIVAELGRAGFIRTFPGRDGGLSLARPSEEISLLQIVEHFEGPLSISPCLFRPNQCPFAENCPVRRRWGRLQALILDELRAITFDQLAAEASSTPLAESGLLDLCLSPARS